MGVSTALPWWRLIQRATACSLCRPPRHPIVGAAAGRYEARGSAFMCQQNVISSQPQLRGSSARAAGTPSSSRGARPASMRPSRRPAQHSGQQALRALVLPCGAVPLHDLFLPSCPPCPHLASRPSTSVDQSRPTANSEWWSHTWPARGRQRRRAVWRGARGEASRGAAGPVPSSWHVQAAADPSRPWKASGRGRAQAAAGHRLRRAMPLGPPHRPHRAAPAQARLQGLHSPTAARSCHSCGAQGGAGGDSRFGVSQPRTVAPPCCPGAGTQEH